MNKGAEYQTIKDYSDICKKNVVKNFKYLYETRKHIISQRSIADYFSQRGVTINQGNISKYIYEQLEIPLGFIVHLGSIYRIPFEKILFIDIQKEEEIGLTSNEGEENIADNLPLLNPSSKNFVTDCSSPELRALTGEYYFYVFPTKPFDAELFDGKLNIIDDLMGNCNLKLEIYINLNDGDEIITKEYTGSLCYSRTMLSNYCTLKHTESGEIVFFVFRVFNPTNTPLQSAIGSALSVGIGRNNHAPILHRILISREEIRKEDLAYAIPFLRLTNSHMIINEKALKECEKEIFKIYGIDNIFKDVISKDCETSSNTYYKIAERAILALADKHFSNDDYAREYTKLLSIVRKYEEAEKINSSSAELDKYVYDLLLSLGYFKVTPITYN